MRIVAIELDPPTLAALPADLRQPGATIEPHSVESLQSLDLSDPAPPSLVISALFTGRYDAQDIAGLLAEKGFRGRYIAVAQSVAEPHVIVGDIAAVAPSVEFDVVTLAQSPDLRLV